MATDDDEGDDDKKLLERWRSGDQRAAKFLVDRHFKAINRFISNKVSPGVADDLVQETFQALFGRPANAPPVKKTKAFLFKIARHKIIDHIRKLDAERNRLAKEPIPSAEVPKTIPSCVAKSQQEECLLRALWSLDLESQMLIELRQLEKVPEAEISEIFGLSLGATKSRLHRARKKLAKAVTELIESDQSYAPIKKSLEAWAEGVREEMWERGDLYRTETDRGHESTG